MEQIKFSDFKIVIDVNSARKEEIDDQTYFSSAYKKYISNSSMGLINPKQDGSPEKYKNPKKITTASLSLGSAIHQMVLEKDEFTLAPKCWKPTAKLGATIDRIKYYRKKGESIENSIIHAASDCDYYKKSIKSKISKVINEGFKYYWITKNYDDSMITLPDKDLDAAISCIANVEKNKLMQRLLHPKDAWGDPVASFNEDALFIDILVTYKDRVITLPIKMKADNWTIDKEGKVLTLNDLKTSSKPVAWFMNEEYGSFYHYHYYRQFALYKMILESYCMKEYGFNHTWESLGNVLVVNTQDYQTRVCKVTEEHIQLGKQEYEELLKRIAYYEIFGYENEVEFI